MIESVIVTNPSIDWIINFIMIAPNLKSLEINGKIQNSGNVSL